MTKSKTTCFECRAGEREDADEPTRLYVITNPDGGPPKRGRLCREHADMLADDGYVLKEIGSGDAPAI